MKVITGYKNELIAELKSHTRSSPEYWNTMLIGKTLRFSVILTKKNVFCEHLFAAFMTQPEGCFVEGREQAVTKFTLFVKM